MMRRFISMLIFLSVCLAGAAQDKTTLQERIDRWKNDMEEFQQRRAPERQAGTRIYVNSTTNFISVNGDRGVVQISPNSFISGPNGLGGITVDGRISGMEVNVNKKGLTRITMNITGVGINAQIEVTLFPGSDDAYVIVTPNFNSQTIRIEGKLVPYSLSRVFEGMSL